MKNRYLLKNKRYEAMGFVEALIAIIVVGIASMVIMNISARTMQEVIQNEAIDTMTQLAVEGGEITQQIANVALKAENPDLFPSNGTEYCYIVDSDGTGNYSFRDTNDDGIFDFYELDLQRDTYKNTAKILEAGEQRYEDYFRVVCFKNNGDDYVVAKVVVGLVVGDGNITKGNLVSDYTYYTVIKMR
jgi:hypothetical protein